MRSVFIVMKKDGYLNEDKPVGVFLNKEDAKHFANSLSDYPKVSTNAFLVVEVPLIGDDLQFGVDDLIASTIYASKQAYETILNNLVDVEVQ